MTYNQGGYPSQQHRPGGPVPPYAQQGEYAQQTSYAQQPAGYGQYPVHGQPQPGYAPPAPAIAAPSGAGAGAGRAVQCAIAVAGLITMVAAFLPWVSVSASFGGSDFSSSVSGTDGGDGWVTLVLGLVAAGVAVAAAVVSATSAPLRLASGVTAVIAGLIVLGLGGYDLVNTASVDAKYSSLVDATAGVGLYVTIVAGVLLAGLGIAAIAVALRRR